MALARFRAWIRVAERELLVTFVLLIILSVAITSMLVTSTLGTGNKQLAGQLVRMEAKHLVDPGREEREHQLRVGFPYPIADQPREIVKPLHGFGQFLGKALRAVLLNACQAARDTILRTAFRPGGWLGGWRGNRLGRNIARG